MTEEDTFKKLKQLPFDIAWNKYCQWYRDDIYRTIPELDQFCFSMGWTWNELMAAAR